MENNKSQAELYREERKERLAKAAEKNAKKAPKNSKRKKVIKRVVAITLAVVLSLSAVIGMLNFFDVPQKTFKYTIKGANAEATSYSFTMGEYNYYYYTTWYAYYSQAAQMEQYGAGMGLMYTGFDYTKAPSDQPYNTETVSLTGVSLEELGNPENATWADAFKFSAINKIISTKYGAEMAKKQNIQLTAQEKTEIDQTIEQFATSAKTNDYGLTRYLSLTFGKGVNEKVIRKALEESYLSQAYFTKLNEDYSNAVTDEQINSKYEENRDNYDIVDIRLYKFTTTIDEKNHSDELSEEEHQKLHDAEYAKTKATADAFLEKVKDEASFIAAAKAENLSADHKSTDDGDKSTLISNTTYSALTQYKEELAKWVYDDARQVGDKTVIDAGSGTYYAVFMKTLPHKDTSFDSADVRHLLVQFPVDENGKTVELTDKVKADTKAEAQKLLDEYLKNPTEENFAALADEHTDDSGSKGKGGLYEDITADSNYVSEFKNWALDNSRTAGDTEIVETTYGYHIMYHVKSEGVAWSSNIRAELSSAEYEAELEKVIDAYTNDISYDTLWLNYATKSEEKFIKELLLRNR